MNGSLNLDYTVARLSRSIRLLSLYMMDNDIESAKLIKEEIKSSQLPMIDNIVMPFMKKDQSVQTSEYPVIISSLDDDINRGINFYMNGYDLYKKMETLARFFVNLNEEDWYTICFYNENRYSNISNLEYRMIDNSKETEDLTYNSINIEEQYEETMNCVDKDCTYDIFNQENKLNKELEIHNINDEQTTSYKEELINDNYVKDDDYKFFSETVENENVKIDEKEESTFIENHENLVYINTINKSPIIQLNKNLNTNIDDDKNNLNNNLNNNYAMLKNNKIKFRDDPQNKNNDSLNNNDTPNNDYPPNPKDDPQNNDNSQKNGYPPKNIFGEVKKSNCNFLNDYRIR